MDRKKKKPAELYVCMFEGYRSFNAYRVHAMKLSDLLTIDRTPTPLFSSDSNLKHVATVAGDDVPRFMGFGLFGSRIVLIGGSPPGCSDFILTYGLETKPCRLIGRVLGDRPPSSSTSISSTISRFKFMSKSPDEIPSLKGDKRLRRIIAKMYDLSVVDDSDGDRESKPSLISRRPRRFKSPDVIPSLKGDNTVTWLREIQGKLYALTVDDSNDEVTFRVFDPKVHPAVWTPLPELPVDYEYRGPVSSRYWPVRPSNIAVLGTKIFVTLPVKHAGEEGKMVYFDVAHPKIRQKWRSIEPCNGRDPIGVCGEIFNNVLVVDLEEDPFDKLLFTLDGDDNIAVSRMVLSDHGLPHTVERVAEIEIRPSSEQLEEYEPRSYKFVHLGGRKVCFVFFCRRILVMLTFEFSYSKSSASPLAGDPAEYSYSYTSGLSTTQQLSWGVLNDERVDSTTDDAKVLTCDERVDSTTGDAEVLTCTPSIKFRGSFSVETLGFRLFDYNPKNLFTFGLGGCFLL